MSDKLSRRDDDTNTQNYYDFAHKLEKRILILEYEIDSIKKELSEISNDQSINCDKQDVHIDKIVDNIANTNKKVDEFILRNDIKFQEWGKFMKIAATIIGGLISLGFAIIQLIINK